MNTQTVRSFTKKLSLAGLLFCLSSTALELGDLKVNEIYYTKDTTIVALHKEQMVTLYKLASSGDKEAFEKFIDGKEVFFIKEGLPVYFIKATFAGPIKIRPKGETIELWTIANGLSKAPKPKDVVSIQKTTPTEDLKWAQSDSKPEITVDCRKLNKGDAYVVSSSIPVWARHASNERASFNEIPKGGAFKVATFSGSAGSPWYGVYVIDASGGRLGKGWIDSKDLQGEPLEPYSD